MFHARFRTGRDRTKSPAHCVDRS